MTTSELTKEELLKREESEAYKELAFRMKAIEMIKVENGIYVERRVFELKEAGIFKKQTNSPTEEATS